MEQIGQQTASDRAGAGGRWYVGQTYPGQEATAVEHVGKRQGFEVFAPGVALRKKMFGKTERPIFPGYIFIFMDLDDPWPNRGVEVPTRWQAISHSRGMIRLLPFAHERPHPIRCGFVERLRGRIEAGEFNENTVEEALGVWYPGESVPVVSGPFSDHVGKLARYHKGCLELLIPLLGREIPVMVPKHQVALAPLRSLDDDGSGRIKTTKATLAPQFGRRRGDLSGAAA